MIDRIDPRYFINQNSILFHLFSSLRLEFGFYIRPRFFTRRKDTERVGLAALGGVWAYHMGRSQNGPKAGRGGKIFFLWCAIFFTFRFYRVFCFWPSLARAQACMLLFNREVGSTLFLDDKHEFYEKG